MSDGLTNQRRLWRTHVVVYEESLRVLTLLEQMLELFQNLRHVFLREDRKEICLG